MLDRPPSEVAVVYGVVDIALDNWIAEGDGFVDIGEGEGGFDVGDLRRNCGDSVERDNDNAIVAPMAQIL